MPEHQQPHFDPALAPVSFPDDGEDEYTLLIESQDAGRDAGPGEQDEAGGDDEVDEEEDDDDADDDDDDDQVDE